MGDNGRGPHGAKEKEAGEVSLSRVPKGDRRQTRHAQQGQVFLYDNSHQLGVPQGHQLMQQSLGNQKLTGPDFRKLFTKDSAPINVAFKRNNFVIQLHKVYKIQTLMSKSKNVQSSSLSSIFNVVAYRAAFDSTKEKSSPPSRAKPPRKDIVAATVKAHGKPHKPLLMRNPMQPDSVMASVRRGIRACGLQQEIGPKKRSGTQFADEGDQGKEVKKVVAIFNNPMFEKIIIKRRDLVTRPTGINEYCMLELSRLGKPACNS